MTLEPQIALCVKINLVFMTFTEAPGVNPKQKDVKSALIANHIELPDKEFIPVLYLLVGPCRTGTSIYLQVFSNSNIDSFNNPIKHSLQKIMFGDGGTFKVQPLSKLFFKESIGAITENESKLNPVEVLIEAKYPADKIKLIANIREPLSTFSSWIATYQDKQPRSNLLQNFLMAYNSIPRIIKTAEKHKIQTTSIVYEAFRDNTPKSVVRALMDRIDIEYTDESIQGWSHPDSSNSRIHFGDRPQIFKRSTEDTFNQSTNLSFFPKTIAELQELLVAEEVTKIKSMELGKMYELIRQRAENDLSITIQPSNQLENFPG